MKDENKLKDNTKAYIISVEGSLGLLAYGDIGLRAWRKIKKNINAQNNNEKK